MSNKENEIKSWLHNKISTLLNIDLCEFETNTDFSELGIDSMEAAEIIAELSDHIGQELEMELIYEYSSIDDLTKFIIGEFINE